MEHIKTWFKNYKKRAYVLFILGLICSLVAGYQLGVFGHHNQEKQVEAPGVVQQKEVKVEKEMPSPEEVKKEVYYGFLMLGSDNGLHPGSDYTDSITYIAYSPQKNKAYAIPIYRDSLIALTCGGEKNINHVYQDNGPECLMKSVSKLLEMPVDYYIYTAADAFVRVVDAIGGIQVTPSETFCSKSSLIKEKKYCVTAGQSYTMDGNMLLSYSRDRNHGSGVPRANRHQDVLLGFARACLLKVNECSTGIIGEMSSKKIAHNLNITTILDLQKNHFQAKTTFDFVALNSIKGTNYADASGAWHMRIDLNSVVEKKLIIQTEFGERS